MATASERAKLADQRHTQEQAQEQATRDIAQPLFERFTTWFDGQSVDALKPITDFPDYPNCLGVRMTEGQGRWTFGKEPATKAKPNLPIIALFQYWNDESSIGNKPEQYSEVYLIYKDHIERGNFSNQTITSRDVVDELTNQINAIVETRPAHS